MIGWLVDVKIYCPFVLPDGTALTQTLSSGAPLRALFQPELGEFQAAFEDAIAEAVEGAGTGVAVVAVVYAGEVLHSTGEWILADSTFSGDQLLLWLDSEAAAAWQPEIQKLPAAPSGVEPIHIAVCTPNAGAKTRWPMAGPSQLVILSKSRRLPATLQISASWRANGKLTVATQTPTCKHTHTPLLNSTHGFLSFFLCQPTKPCKR